MPQSTELKVFITGRESRCDDARMSSAGPSNAAPSQGICTKSSSCSAPSHPEGVGKRGKARAASYEPALGEAKELIVALDCVEIDQLAKAAEIVAAQDLADRVAAMLTKLIRSV